MSRGEFQLRMGLTLPEPLMVSLSMIMIDERGDGPVRGS